MRYTVAAGVAAAAAALVLGCSKSSTAPLNATPTQADAQAVATGVESAVETSIASFMGGINPVTPSLARVSASRLPYFRLAHVPADLLGKGRMGIRTRSVPCITETPSTPTDTDGDGVPDTVSMQAAGSSCTLTSDTTTLTIQGQMDLGDPTPSVADAAYDATVTNLNIGIATPHESASIGLNGTASVTPGTGSLSEANQLTLTVASSGIPTPVNASYAQDWTATFNYTGAAITNVSNGGLPNGTLDITGTTAFTGNSKSFALSISTPTALAYDPTCNTTSQITSGVLKATFNSTNGSAYVTIAWSGCQDPTVDFVTQ